VSEETLTALIGIIPQLLLIVIIGAVVIALRRPIFENVLPRVSRVSVIGLQVDLQPTDVRRALEAQASPSPRPMPTDAGLGAIGRRAERNADIIVGRTAVWIDDHPEWTVAERLVLH
jgi:hypothetical protein